MNCTNKRGETLLSLALKLGKFLLMITVITYNKFDSNFVFVLGRTSMVNQLHKYGAKDNTKSKSEDAELEKIFEKYLQDKGRKIPKFLRRKH